MITGGSTGYVAAPDNLPLKKPRLREAFSMEGHRAGCYYRNYSVTSSCCAFSISLEKVQDIFNLSGAPHCRAGRDVRVFHSLDGVTYYHMQPNYRRLAIGTDAFCRYIGSKRNKEAAREKDDDDKHCSKVLFFHSLIIKQKTTIRVV